MPLSHWQLPELETHPPIVAEWEGKATNRALAMKQTYLHNKMEKGAQHKHGR